jgi:nucleotide-binding universal stress UspA family protein
VSLAAPGLEVMSRLLRVHPYELVRETFAAELFVVGVPATRPLSGLDSVATSALAGGHCPVLLVPKWS